MPEFQNMRAVELQQLAEDAELVAAGMVDSLVARFREAGPEGLAVDGPAMDSIVRTARNLFECAAHMRTMAARRSS